MENHRAIILIFGALVLRECFQLFPAGEFITNPFPFKPMTLSIQAYAYFAFTYISMALFAWAFLLLMPVYETILTAWFFLQCIEVFDYFLTYNSDWFTLNLDFGRIDLGELGVSITLVKFTILAGLIIHRWI